jgi:three-Cys-motif partner protein
MVEINDYVGREQAFVKHFVLDHYLGQLALKVGQFKPGTTLNFIDGFSGPWQQATEELRDTSPHVALTKLLAAKRDLAQVGKSFTIRGFFVESDPIAHPQLVELLRDFPDIEVEPHLGRFEDMIGPAVEFAGSGTNPFAFIFIDPTGWSGYGLRAITPLLRVSPCEVLINFMTKDIIRFIDDTASTALESFVDLFGDAGYREAWRGLDGLDREDRIVETYCERLRRAGDFKHVGATLILHPRQDRTHYHLVYATRSLHGLIAFRETERTAMPHQFNVRAGAKQRQRIETHAQHELFPAVTMETPYIDELRERYQGRAFVAAEARLKEGRPVKFDELVALTLQNPMMSLGDLKQWLNGLHKAAIVRYRGVPEGKRALAIQQGHTVEWLGGPA